MDWTDRFDTSATALCIGLDPVPERLPAGLDAVAFCRRVVELTAEYAACYKPNVAFFERLGPDALAGLAGLMRWIRESGRLVIADAKRGDIASTAAAYAQAYFGGPFDADALTVNPFLGLDTLEPFRDAAREHGRGVFVLLRTSNPGAALLQRPGESALAGAIRDEPVFGAVVGATDGAAAAAMRAALPETLFLVPGFGAQGGSALAPVFRPDGSGAVVNSSRGILYAGEGEASWEQAVRAAAQAAHRAIEKARGR